MCLVLPSDLLNSANTLLVDGLRFTMLGQPIFEYLEARGVDLGEIAVHAPRVPLLTCEWGILDGKFFLRKAVITTPDVGEAIVVRVGNGAVGDDLMIQVRRLKSLVTRLVGHKASWFSGEIRADNNEGEVVFVIERGVVTRQFRGSMVRVNDRD